jgi:hypothetical protein
MSTPDAKFFLDLTDLVPRRETCEKMSKRGFDMVTHFFWDHDRILRAERGFHPSPVATRLPAPTAAELGAALPETIELADGKRFFLQGWPLGETHFVQYNPLNHGGRSKFEVRFHTEAEARAWLWLRLESEGLLLEDDD